MRQRSPHSPDEGGAEGRARDAAGPSSGGDPRVVHFDSLRGIAALWVVLFHCGTESWINWAPGLGGYTAHLNVGVTLFFLLSGYLLYRPFVTAALAGSPGPSLRRYFRHRAFRILPAYWVALTLLGLWPGLNGVFTQDWWLYYGLLQSYWGSFYGGIGPAWSLSVEATFYLLLPAVAYGMAAASSKVPARQRHVLQSRLLLVSGIAGVGLNWLARSQRWPDSIIANWDWFVLGMWLSLVRVRLETEGARPRWLDWCTRNPSATSPATSVIAGPTPARWRRGMPCGEGPGSKKGVMSVCV